MAVPMTHIMHQDGAVTAVPYGCVSTAVAVLRVPESTSALVTASSSAGLDSCGHLPSSAHQIAGNHWCAGINRHTRLTSR